LNLIEARALMPKCGDSLSENVIVMVLKLIDVELEDIELPELVGLCVRWGSEWKQRLVQDERVLIATLERLRSTFEACSDIDRLDSLVL